MGHSLTETLAGFLYGLAVPLSWQKTGFVEHPVTRTGLLQRVFGQASSPMPEMPEVETIVRGLRGKIVGETVAAVRTWWGRSIAKPTAAQFERRLVGRRVAGVRRRGKFVVVGLHPPEFLLIHLGMTGQLLVESAGRACLDGAIRPDAHTHVLILFASGNALRFRDVRKFGRLYLVDDPGEILGSLGPEPLSDLLTPSVLRRMLEGRRRRIKFLLLDQSFLAGLGNIYADESLWEAGIHPLRRSHTMTASEAKRLHSAIRAVLSRAVENRGTTSRDYRDPENQPGRNQAALAVYQRQGLPCKRCGQPIVREVMEQRATHYCPVCQPLQKKG